MIEPMEGRLLLTTYTVDSVLDVVAADGVVTLREALEAANSDSVRHDAPAGSGPDTITFTEELFSASQTINVGAPLSITSDLTLTGPGARKLTINALNTNPNQRFRVMEISGNVSNAYVSGLTLTGGRNPTADYASALNSFPLSGATIVFEGMAFEGNSSTIGHATVATYRGNTTLINCLLANNSERALITFGPLNLINSTISGNTATANGAGFYVGTTDPVVVRNSTITNNRCDLGNTGFTGGGIFHGPDRNVVIENSIVAGNFRGPSGANADDVAGDFAFSSGYNVIGSIVGSTGLDASTTQYGTTASPLSPLLGTLGYKDIGELRALTKTHQPIAGSAAINMGSVARALDAAGNPLITDQRGPGFPRTLGPSVDVGAVEAAVPSNDTGSISGLIWRDRNINSEREAGDVGIPQVPVHLYLDDGDGVPELGTADPLVQGRTTQTSSEHLGEFEFTGLAPGEYWVDVDESSPVLGGHRQLSATPTSPLTVTSGQELVGVDTIYYKPIVAVVTDDENDGNTNANDISLREAVALAAAAPGVDVVELHSSPSILPYELGLGPLVFNSDLILQGLTPQQRLVYAGSTSRVGTVTAGATVEIRNLAFINGRPSDGGASLTVQSGGTLRLKNVEISDNTALTATSAISVSAGATLSLQDVSIHDIASDGPGAAIRSSGALTILNSTFYQNESAAGGGAIQLDAGTATVVNATFVKNVADRDGSGAERGGAIQVAAGAVLTMHNTLVAENERGPSTDRLRDDVFGAATIDSSFNLVSVADGSTGLDAGSPSSNILGDSTNPLDTRLGRAETNTGRTSSFNLFYGSPAIEGGGNTIAAGFGLSADQRGASRFTDYDHDTAARIDIGAYECNATLVVTTLADEQDTNPAALSLREAIEYRGQTPGMDAITFDPSLSGGTIQLNFGYLYLGTDMSIVGPGSDLLTIDARRLSRVMYIDSASARLEGFTITNGESGLASDVSHGGGIFSTSADLFMRDVTVYRCQENADTGFGWDFGNGGGIYNHNNAKIELVDCELIENISRNNRDSGARGGGALYNGPGAVAHLTRTRVVGNYAHSDGSGLLNSATATMTIEDCDISSNITAFQFGRNGGGIYNAGTMSVRRTAITLNWVRIDGVGGGGIYNDTSGNLFLDNVTVGSNTYEGIRNFGSLTILNSTIFGNAGNGINIHPGATTRLYNTAMGGHGASHDISGPIASESAYNFISSAAANVGITDGTNGNRLGTIEQQLDPRFGPLAVNGGFSRTHRPQSDSPLIDTGSTALALDPSGVPLPYDQRGAGYARVVGVSVDIGAVEIGGQGFVGDLVWNDANANAVRDPGEVGIDGVTVRLYASDGDAVFESGGEDTFIGFRTTQAGGAYTFTDVSPGQYWVDVDQTSAALTQFTVTTGNDPVRVDLVMNQQKSDVDFGFRPRYLVSLALDESDGNYVAGDLSLREALLLARNNPGVDLIEFSPALAGATITLSPTLGPLLADSDVTLAGLADRPTVSANGAGRVISVAAGVTVDASDLILSDGQSSEGGVVHVAGGTLRLTRAKVADGVASLRGGGIYVAAGATLELRDSEVTASRADVSGGGIYSEGALTLRGSTFWANQSTSTVAGRGRGGGVYSAGALVVLNSTIANNTATLRGGGLYSELGTHSLVNVTLAGNTVIGTTAQVGGGGLYVDAADVVTHNTLIADNRRTATAARDDMVGAVNPTGTQNLISSAGAVVGLAMGFNGNQIGTPSVPIDARLMALSDYGGPTPTFALALTSPAVDAGSNAAAAAQSLTADHRGNPRVVDGNGDTVATVDIGAFEAASAIVVDSLLDETSNTDGKTSFREALLQANATPGLDTIQFSTAQAVLNRIDVPATLGEFELDGILDVQGRADQAVLLNGLSASRVVRVAPDASVILSDLTVRGGSSVGGGAGILNDGTLQLRRVLVADNHTTAGDGGGILNNGQLIVSNSTLSGNSAAGGGGGLHNAAGTATLTNVTVTNNTAGAGGGAGIKSAAVGNAVALHNTVIADNQVGPADNDVSGGFDPASSFNFIGAIDGSTGLLEGAGLQWGSVAQPADARLISLADRGGPTETHGQLPASPVTDTGSNAVAQAAGLVTDQRGLPRVREGNGDAIARVDKGAFEQQVPLNVAPSLTNVQAIPGAVEAVSFAIPHSLLLSRSDAHDDDGNPIAFRIESIIGGTLTANGAAVVPGVTLLSPGDSLLWAPPTIEFGDDHTKVVQAFSVSAWDGQVGSGSAVPVGIEVTTTAEPVNYAVLFSGGNRTELNYPIYYQNLRRLFDLLTTRYGVQPHDVAIVYADGTNPGPDQRGNVNSDMSFATAAGATVTSATGANLRTALQGVAAKADANDHFFLWTFDHGLGTTNQPVLTGEEVLKGWGPSEEIADEQLRAWTQGLLPGEGGSSFDVPDGYQGVQAGFSSYVFAQCFAGGMLDDFDLARPNVFGAASSNHYEASYADYFAGAFNDALALGYGNTHDAYRYTVANNGRAAAAAQSNGGTWTFNVEHPWSSGSSFPIFATPRDQNAAPELRSVAPLRIASGAAELAITYDMLVAAADATDPTGQALVFRVTSEDVGELWRDGHRISLSNTADTTVSLGQSLLWKKPAGAAGTINAFSLKLVADDGSESLAKVVPIRVGSPAGLTAMDDTKLIQQSAAEVLVDVLANDTIAGTAQVLRVGVAEHGTVTVDPLTGQVRYTPAAEYLGPDTFSYLLSNGTTSDLATVSVVVVPFDPQAAATGQRYSVQVLGAPEGWAGLPAEWGQSYLDSLPNWTSSRGVDINDQGDVLVHIARAETSAVTFVGMHTASYRWSAGDVEPYWDRDISGGNFTTNTLTFLRGMAFDRDDDGELEPMLQPAPYPDRQIYGGASILSVKNRNVAPAHYKWTENTFEFSDPGALLFSPDSGGLWSELPRNIYITDVSPTENNAGSYLAAAANQSPSGQRAELWEIGLDGNSMVLQLPGWGGNNRSRALAINDDGWVVGYAEANNDIYEPFLYNGTATVHLGVLPGTVEGQALAVSDVGHVVGFTGPNEDPLSGQAHGFIWENQTMSELPALGGSGWSVAYDVNREGVAVGASNGRAVVWVDGEAIDLNAQVDQLPANTLLTSANGINSAGQIVATGTLNGQTRAFFLDLASALQAVPDAVETSSRTIAQFDVLSNDHGARSVSFVDQTGLQGQLSWSPSGLMTFDPAGAFSDLVPGQQRTTGFTYTARDNLGGTQQTTVTITVSALSTFHVVSATGGPTGAVVRFSGDVDLNALNLYDGQDAAADLPDVTLTGPTGNVRGSLAWTDADNTLRFVPSGGVLAAGAYTLSVVGQAGRVQAAAGSALDGDGDDVAGGMFTLPFTVAAHNRTLSIPDFARGPGQAVDLGGGGIPVRISDGSSVRSIDFKLVWDPSLLTIGAITADPSMPSGWGVSVNPIAPGVALVSLSGPQPGLAAGAHDVLRLAASVPASAPYLASQAIRIEDFVYNNVTTGLVGDVALHKVAYPGDVTGDGSYGALDPARISRVVLSLDSGFDPIGTTDPLIVGDADGDGAIRSYDAVLLADKIAGFAVSEIPDLPGVVVSPPPSGPESVVTLGSINLAPGAQDNVSATIDAGASVQGFVFTIGFDPARLDVLSAALGSLLPAGWSYSFNPDQQPGRAKVVAFSPHALAQGTAGGQLLSLDVQALAGASPGQDPLGLEGSLNDGGLTLTAVDGGVTIGAGGLPAWLAPGGAVTWNPFSKLLTVTGAATIIADPGGDLPDVVADGSQAVLTINPATGSAIHLGALHLSNGATATVTSVGPVRSAVNHRVLVIHGDDGDLSIDSFSVLDLTDNDLVLDYDTTPPDVAPLLPRGFSASENWSGSGIVSSAAALDSTVWGLGYADNASLPDRYGTSLGGPLFAGVDVDDTALLVKFTWVGDLNLDGFVNFSDVLTFNGTYDDGVTAGHFWAEGDFNYDGFVGFSDLLLFNGAYDEEKLAL